MSTRTAIAGDQSSCGLVPVFDQRSRQTMTTNNPDPVTGAAIDQAVAVAVLAHRIADRLRQAACPPFAVALALVDLQRLTVQLQDHIKRLE